MKFWKDNNVLDKQTKKTIIDYIIFGSILVLILVTFRRLFFGTEITDEAYYIAEARIVAHGAVPFVNNWTQAPGYVILYAWLVRIYECLVPNLEGIFIFMRIAYFMFRMLILFGCFQILKKHIDKRVLAMALLVLIPFNTLIPMFSYNTITINLLILTGSICIDILLNKKQDSRWYKCTIVGGLVAFIIYAHPAQILNFFAIGLGLVLFQRKHWMKAMCSFISGAGFVTILISSWMIWQGGGVKNLIFGIDSILNYNAYFKLGHSDIWLAVISLFDYIKVDICLLIMIELIVFITYIFWKRINKQEIKYSVNYSVKLMEIGMYIWFPIVITNILLYTNSIDIEYKIGERIAFFSILLFLIKNKNNLDKYLGCFIILPSINYFIINGFFSYCSIYTRLYVLIPCCIPLIIMSYDDIKKMVIMKQLWCVFVTGVLALAIVKSNYEFFYRDDNFFNLTNRVEEGIYKGIYTTDERASDLISLEKYIKNETVSGEAYLFMEVVPMAYLMSNGECSAPSTWDIMLYSYGFNDDIIMQRYYKLMNMIPNKVIYIDTGRDETLSIDKEGYIFNEFISSNYDLTYETDIGTSFYVKTYLKKKK